MTDATTAARRLFVAFAAALALLPPLAAALAAGSPIPVLVPAARPERPEPPMRIVRVASAAPECGRDCPEWISAEGTIVPGTAAALGRTLAELHGRRLPGPDLFPRRLGARGDRDGPADPGEPSRGRGGAHLSGELPRPVEGLSRAGPGDGRWGDVRLRLPLVLAAGVERLVGPSPKIGVHQITTVFRETPGGDRPVHTVKVVEQAPVDRTVDAYLAAAGVGEPVMDLLRKTPPASIRWLSLAELEGSRLATAALAPSSPIRTEGGGGLDGVAFGASGPLVAAARVPDADGLGAVLTLSYRRGGGALALALAPPGGPATPPPAGWSLTAAGDVLAPVAGGDGSSQALLPRETFCAPGDRRIVATAAQSAQPLAFALDGAPGVAELVAEACP